MAEEAKENDPMDEESTRLVGKLFDDFSNHVNKSDLSEILLKGHLLIEHYLDHIMLLIFDKKANLKKKSFYIKITEIKDKNCFQEHENTIDCLFALNKVRNELAHKLDFEVTLSQIDEIGYNIGRDYILRRYSKSMVEKELLLWVLEQIIIGVYYPIWKDVLDSREKGKT